MRWRSLSLCLSVLAGIASAASPDDLDPATQQALQEWEQRYEQVRQDHARALAARGDSRSLLAAAEIASGVPLAVSPVDAQEDTAGSAQALAWFRAALTTEPVDPLALWLAVSRCSGSGAHAERSCDHGDGLQRLVMLDPDNALVWFHLAVDASQAGDASQADRHFARAADAPRFDSYDRAYGRLLLDAHEGLEIPPPSPGLIAAISRQLYGEQPEQDVLPSELLDVTLMARWTTFAFPALSHVAEFCPTKAPATMTPARHDDCRALLATMADSATTLLVKQVGLSFMAQLTRADDDGAHWLERLRQFSWRYAGYLDLFQTGMEPVPGHIRRVLADGELAALEHARQATGDASEAPHGWIPEHGTARELLLAATATD